MEFSPCLYQASAGACFLSSESPVSLAGAGSLLLSAFIISPKGIQIPGSFRFHESAENALFPPALQDLSCSGYLIDNVQRLFLKKKISDHLH
jgi:hypothetical protein